MEKENNQIIYVDLDCLLDTRLGLIRSTFPQWEEKVLTKYYWTRSDNKFKQWALEFPQRDFDDTWRERTYEHIRGVSPATVFAPQLKDFCLASRLERNSHLGMPTITVHVNTFPYKIPTDSLELLRRQLTGFLFVDEIKFCNLHYHDVALEMLEEGTQYVIYDFDAWINTQIEHLKLVPKPGTGVIVPYIAKQVPEMKVKDLERKLHRIFQLMFDFTMQPLSFFSVKQPDETKK